MAQDERKTEPDAAARIRETQASLARSRSAQAASVPLIGPSTARYESREKVTGQARYAGDVGPVGAAYAYAISAPVARGRITRMDVSDAQRVPGVLRIYDHQSMKGRVKPLAILGEGGYAATSLTPMSGPDIAHDGQIVGLVVAESYEAAREAANRVKLDIQATKPSACFGDPGLRTRPLSEVRKTKMWKDPKVGNADAAFSAAPLKVEAEYATPTQHHNPIELYSTTCMWSDGRLTIHEPSAGVNILKHGVAEQLGIVPELVDVISPFVGGMFGSKVAVTSRTVVIALAARDLGRPVKCVSTREQGFTNATHRAETRHKVKLSCGTDGRLASYGHEGSELTSRTDAYTVNGTQNTVHMYAWPALDTKVLMVEADRNTPGFMRSPPEVPYMFALEVAMDEMAEKAGIDPVKFRQINDAQTSTYENKRFTSRSVIQCLNQGATAFGWSRRNPRPGSMRDGDWLVGYGVAMASYPTVHVPAAVRVRVLADGTAAVQIAAHDPGTGAYTMAAMIAGQELGIDPQKVRVEMGDSRLPPGPLAGGSNTTASICNAIAQACSNIRVRLNVAPGQAVTMALTSGAVEEYLDWAPPGLEAAKAMTANYKGQPEFWGGAAGADALRFAFGAEFVEVRVHARTREIRVPRITGAFAAGRIMNKRTAHSQLMGGLIWGIGSALHEATEIDRRASKYVNDNIAEYLIPVNADIPAVEVIMIPEDDREANALGIKGVGELGNVGTAAAIANAVYHATGKRVRDLPIRIENLLPDVKRV
ncbi:MAG: xanthine dehydrogenase family protein molybdopterin-binding subunit [Anaerolineae bacterium]|nr:xanthine dehydrogenase family protein molybdopterin-binding subunit [Gloeobacterales cyanobacterium ES-bin-313]